MATRELNVPVEPTAWKGKRRLLPIIDAQFQWKYTLIVTLLGVGTGAVMGGLLYNAHRANTRLLELGSDPELLQRVEHGDNVFLLYLVLCLLGLAGGLCVWGLVVTHRIAGPMYLAARYIEQMRHGDYPEVRPLRKHDELRHVFNILGALSQKLRERDAAMYKVIDEALTQVRKAIDNPAQAQGALKEAVQVLQNEHAQHKSAAASTPPRAS